MRFRRPASSLLVAVLWLLAVLPSAASEHPHHDIKLRINPDNRTFRVTDRITLSGPDDLTLSVADWMRIRAVLVDGRPVETAASGPMLRVSLPGPGRHRIDVTANGVIPPRQDGHRPGSVPFAGSDGVYLPGWSKWSLLATGGDATYRLTVVTPATHRAAATGALQSETLGDTENRAVFGSEIPGQAASVFVGPYAVADRPSNGLRIRTYFHPEASGLAEHYLDAAETYIRMFERSIGPYPFADFHMVSAPVPVGLGFANLTYVDRRILPLPFMRGRSLAHEVLHNWWGNGVHVDYATGNWSEGLTTYMADHAVAEQDSAAAAREMRLGWLRDYAALPAERDAPVVAFVSKRHDAAQVIGYGKVAFIFAMLEHEVGPKPFSAAIRHFWNTHQFETAGWSQIETAFEETTDRDLGWFFDQWTRRAGAPLLTLEEADVLPRDDAFLLDLALVQSAPAYRLKVPVLVTTEAGPRRFDVPVDGPRTELQLQLDAEPLAVRIDPEHRIFRRLLPGEAPPILRDVLLDRNARAVLLHEHPANREGAVELVNRLIAAPDLGTDDQAETAVDRPLVVVGSTEQISRFIESSGLPARPASMSDRGSGRAWTARRPGGHAVLLVEADDPQILRAMTRRLPHYRSKSFVVFDGQRVSEHGVWDMPSGPLTQAF